MMEGMSEAGRCGVLLALAEMETGLATHIES